MMVLELELFSGKWAIGRRYSVSSRVSTVKIFKLLGSSLPSHKSNMSL